MFGLSFGKHHLLLRDAATNQVLPLTPGTSYRFSVTTAQASALVMGRFTVQFAPTAPLATMSAVLAGAVALSLIRRIKSLQ